MSGWIAWVMSKYIQQLSIRPLNTNRAKQISITSADWRMYAHTNTHALTDTRENK